MNIPIKFGVDCTNAWQAPDHNRNTLTRNHSQDIKIKLLEAPES